MNFKKTYVLSLGIALLYVSTANAQLTLYNIGASYNTLATSLSADPNIVINNASGARISPNQMAFFMNAGLTRLEVNQGIVFSTGDVISVNPPQNFVENTTTEHSFSAVVDAELATLSVPGASMQDYAILEFDIRLLVGNTINFSYVFASDEYPEFVCSLYDDAFGLWIRGGTQYPTYKNLALTPTGNYQVSVNYINTGPLEFDFSGCPTGFDANAGYYISNPLGSPGLEPDGLTKRMTSSITVTPNVTYHFKIGLADVADGSWDSWAFIAANFASLPVDLQSFRGQLLDESLASIHWNVRDEKNFSHYVLQKSTQPNVGFSDVATILGNKGNYYHYTDPIGNYEIMYYRLKMVDLDGASTYSTVVTVDRSAANGTGISASVDANKQLLINIDLNDEVPQQVQVYSVTGAELVSQQLDVEISKGEISLGDFSGKQAGVYLVKVTTEDHSYTTQFFNE